MSGFVDIDMAWPERGPGEPGATMAQCLSVARFYTFLPDDLGFEQAHALLSYRNFAREAVAAVLRIDCESGAGRLLARRLAATISTDASLAAAAIEWSEHNFEHADEPIPIERTPLYVGAARLLSRWYEEL